MSKTALRVIARSLCACMVALCVGVLGTPAAYAGAESDAVVVEDAGDAEIVPSEDEAGPEQEVGVSDEEVPQQTSAQSDEADVVEESAGDGGATGEETNDGSSLDSQSWTGGENVEISPGSAGSTIRASDTNVVAIIYNDGRLVIGTNLSRANMYKGWIIGENNVIYDQWFQWGTNPNPWTDYREDIKSVEVVSRVKVLDARSMFAGVKATTADVSKLDVSSCSNFHAMFYANFWLKTLDMCDWEVNKSIIDDAEKMFYWCESLQTVKVGSRFVFPDPLPDNEVNGHTDWLSVRFGQWYSANTIYQMQNADPSTDTFRKSSSTDVSELNIVDTRVWFSNSMEWTCRKMVRDGDRILIAGRHYRIEFPKYDRVGTYMATVYGIGIYTGQRKVPIHIVPCPIWNTTPAHIDGEWWNGGVHTPLPPRPLGINDRTLVKDVDYWVSYENNDRPGIGKVIYHGMGNYTSTEEQEFDIFCSPSVKYRTHVQTFGWRPYVYNGDLSGTTGMAKRLEGINIELFNAHGAGGIRYRTHVQKKGWQGWRYDGRMSGTSKKSLRLEAIQIELTGGLAKYYDVYYRVHCQRFGWMGWAKNGQKSGSAGYSRRLEGIQIVLVKKGDPAPGKTLAGITQRYSAPFKQRGRR